MNKFEKFENAIHLEPVSCKQDIPVYAHMCTYAAVPAGMTQKDLFSGNDVWLNAMVKAYEVIGADPDVVFPMGPDDVCFIAVSYTHLSELCSKTIAELLLTHLFIKKEVMTALHRMLQSCLLYTSRCV